CLPIVSPGLDDGAARIIAGLSADAGWMASTCHPDGGTRSRGAACRVLARGARVVPRIAAGWPWRRCLLRSERFPDHDAFAAGSRAHRRDLAACILSAPR